ncbi:hypothetical protein A3I48_03745 [Candidatus Daviesbacteria bacterium RIFCSPLOWO2_02_FULL_36_7]|uniref:DUF4926 domain-containing protein n=1 Tax=Candidatus Daviesbacteria bacterium RIFCSPLOWO2_02_FULL_36_7 TaxID=1797792 RepID=A0A1F5MHS8_9BACT|nr:MAG: hypothetical protein A3I48_03745 [Candidatus Daviesbacteria bacterium RIFCSPLOWO2_02_FULL_36_7]
MFEELEIVELAQDIKEHNLKEGERGTIVEIYKDGEAYEVEFVASDGRTTALLTLMPNDIRSAMNKDEYLYHGSNVSVYLSTASGTVSAEHISNEELRFNMDTPKSKADRYLVPML